MAEKTEGLDHKALAQKNLTQALNQAERIRADEYSDAGEIGLIRAGMAQAHASLATAEQLERLNDQLEKGAIEVLYGGSTV